MSKVLPRSASTKPCSSAQERELAAMHAELAVARGAASMAETNGPPLPNAWVPQEGRPTGDPQGDSPPMTAADANHLVSNPAGTGCGAAQAAGAQSVGPVQSPGHHPGPRTAFGSPIESPEISPRRRAEAAGLAAVPELEGAEARGDPAASMGAGAVKALVSTKSLVSHCIEVGRRTGSHFIYRSVGV